MRLRTGTSEICTSWQRCKILGCYIIDFYCAKAKLVIELDGSQLYFDAHKAYDEERTAFLSEYGISVLRIPNTEINRNFSGVCEWIDLHVKEALEGNNNPPVTYR